MTQLRPLHTIELSITLKTPWLVHGNDPGRFGLDATLLRNHRGQQILPGSLITGRIRAAWEEMQNMDLPMPAGSHWFGGKETEPRQQRAKIWTDDLAAEKSDDALLMATRVHIDADTGAAQSGMLMLAEQTQPAGNEITFTGQWRACLSADEVESLQANLTAGLLWHSQLGAQRSVGFGEILRTEISIVRIGKAKAQPSESALAERTLARLKLQFDSPLCVDTRNQRGNVFESSDIITGGTLKATLATLMNALRGKSIADQKDSSKLAEHFDAIRICHALPASDAEKRPCAIPYSFVAVNKDVLDVAPFATAHLIDAQCPAFIHDWKGETWGAINHQRGWGKTGSHLRVRTAIDAKTRTAQDGDLFAYQCKVALDNTKWLADISLPDTIPEEDRQEIWKELAELLANGLGPIGKTDAWAIASLQVEQGYVWPSQSVSQPVRGDTVTLMLNTPALLFASSQVADQQPDLSEIYKQAFADISKHTLELSHFYASQSMAGGEFLWNRFIKERPEKFYRPYVLTDAGSVFVLKIVGEQDVARKCIEDWQANGLELPKAVKDEHGDSWKSHPYLPQNGYGEIAVNMMHPFPVPTPDQLTSCIEDKK